MFVKISFVVFLCHIKEVVVAAKKATVFIKVFFFLIYVNTCKLASACKFKYKKNLENSFNFFKRIANNFF